MNITALFEMTTYFFVLIVMAIPLGKYMASIYQDEPVIINRILRPFERVIYRVSGIDPQSEMRWYEYAYAVLLFNGMGFLMVYFLQRCQVWLPLNPQAIANATPDLAFNTAVSFATNTNWQAYSGESSMSYLTQMLGLGVQNFLSAASGMAVLIAFIRGLTRTNTTAIGNFWVDMTRSTLYILLPMSMIFAMILVSQGVVQTFSSAKEFTSIEPTMGPESKLIETQTIPLGPAASQVAIKQLGTNGGGFFGVNSAHPLENPNPMSNFFQLIAILLIPTALCFTFGHMVKDKSQGIALLSAMFVIFIPLLAICYWNEIGNLEGKEVRFGVGSSVLWAAATTAASNGSVNSMHDSYTALGGLIPMWLIQLGEVIFGGVGSGLYGLIVFAIVAVFIAGLMVGRTPEYLGKKIEAYEMKMAALVILVPPILVLVGTAIAVSFEAGTATVTNPGPHGLSQVLYALSSAGNNNGSAFAGLGVNNLFYNTLLGVVMFAARYWLMIPVLALAGSLANKKRVPVSSGTLPTHTPLFVIMLVSIVLLVGALTFIPALALGPVAEYLS